jgi:site-specific recombinase XerD
MLLSTPSEERLETIPKRGLIAVFSYGRPRAEICTKIGPRETAINSKSVSPSRGHNPILFFFSNIVAFVHRYMLNSRQDTLAASNYARDQNFTSAKVVENGVEERAHVSNVSPHDPRHRFGYRMAQSVSLHRLAQLIGHDSLDTTLIYVQGTKNDLQQAVETIALR